MNDANPFCKRVCESEQKVKRNEDLELHKNRPGVLV
jgi:hypothetical protein